jgi:hypothetical protein
MTERAREVVWVVDHLTDLEADFRAFYRLTPADVAQMSGPHFLALATRTTAYQGVMASRVAALEETSTTADGEVSSTPTALQNDPALSDVIDYG